MRGPIGMWKQLVMAALLLGGGWMLWSGQGRLRDALGIAAETGPQANGRRSTGAPVIVAPVGMARDDLVIEVVGTGRAQRSVTLRPEAEGKVAEVALAAGQRYTAGEVLLRLDDSDQRLTLALAETRLAEAERVRARYTRLKGSGTAATATLEEAVMAAEIARIELERARDALAKRVLRAPFAGVAGLPSVEVGDWVDTGDEIAAYDDRSVLLVEFELPEAYLGRIATGLPVRAHTPAFRDRVFEGGVSAIDSRVNATSRAARVRIAIPNQEDLLRPGASFAIALELAGGRFPLVPELAVQFSRGALHVWRVSGGKAEQVPVRLVRRRAGEVLVEGPLAEGDRVVVEGTQRLGPGKPVTVIEAPAGGAS